MVLELADSSMTEGTRFSQLSDLVRQSQESHNKVLDDFQQELNQFAEVLKTGPCIVNENSEGRHPTDYAGGECSGAIGVYIPEHSG